MQKYRKMYQLKSYECDASFRLRLMSLFNFFQDVADGHAEEMGVGYTFCEHHKIGWVGANYHVQIERIPTWREPGVLSTWPSGTTAVSGIRDFQMTDETGTELIKASSQWVVVDIEKKRPVPVKKHLPDYEVIDEWAVETTFPKWAPVTRADMTLQIPVLHDHIDFNKHVNNAYYSVWAMDSLPETFLQTHQLSQLEVAFKKPALLGDVVTVSTQINDLETCHDLTKGDTILASVRCRWKEIA